MNTMMRKAMYPTNELTAPVRAADSGSLSISSPVIIPVTVAISGVRKRPKNSPNALTNEDALNRLPCEPPDERSDARMNKLSPNPTPIVINIATLNSR